jgi:PEP-CTERM motif
VSLAAQAAVIDFNGINVANTTNPAVAVSQPYVEDGFVLTTFSGSPYTHYAGGTIYALTPANTTHWSGSPSVYSGVITNYGSGFSLKRADNGVFDLISMDAAPFSSAGGYRNFSVFGYPATGGGYVRQDFVLDATWGLLETLALDSRFKNLTSIQFSSVYAQVDNIQLSYPGEVLAASPTTVPEPDSVLMALAGLGVAGWLLRRQVR